MTTAFIGQPVSRVDGRQKVTGAATYAAESRMLGLAHGALVRSTVAKGRIASIDTTEAERAPGVVAVLTHRNAPRLAYRAHKAMVDPAIGERLHVLQDDRVNHQGQPIALVAKGHMLLAVSPDAPFKTVVELIDYARKNPGKLSNASSSNGSPGHVGGELFKSMSATDIVHVAHKASGEARNAVIGGHVQMMIDAITTTATREGDAHRLSGVKWYVLDGHTADLILVVARAGQGALLRSCGGGCVVATKPDD